MWKKKLGPLPAWGWGGILLGAALLWSFGRNRASGKDSTGDATDGTEAETVPSDQVPDFISQVYTTVNNNMPAPTAPPPTSTQPAPVTTPPVSPPKTTTPPPKTTPAKPAPKPAPKKPLQYKVKSGDTLSSIAKKYGTTWQALWTFNTTKGNRPDSTIATLKKRGPNLLYSGETILVPQK